RANYEAAKAEGEAAKPPEPLNLDEMAKSTDFEGVTAQSIPLISPQDLAQTELGKSKAPVADNRTQAGLRNASAVELVFGRFLELFQPMQSRDVEGNDYLFWITDKTKASIQPLDRIHSKVVKAWKMVQARKLAQQEADKLVAQA